MIESIDFTVTERRSLPSGSLALAVVLATGRKLRVQVPFHLSDQQGIAQAVDAHVRAERGWAGAR